MALRVLVTDGMDAGAMEQLRKDGYEVIEQFYEPDQLGAALRDFDVAVVRSKTKVRKAPVYTDQDAELAMVPAKPEVVTRVSTSSGVMPGDCSARRACISVNIWMFFSR